MSFFFFSYLQNHDTHGEQLLSYVVLILANSNIDEKIIAEGAPTTDSQQLFQVD